jgi:hypothetical protein
MAKGQKKSSREAKKPKADKKIETPSLSNAFSQPLAAKSPTKRPSA